MLEARTTTTRAPRGTKPVSQAFFTALEGIPEASRAAVAKAAHAMIRDQLKAMHEKSKAAGKNKTRVLAKAKRSAKTHGRTSTAKAPATTKRRSPRQPEISAAA